MGAHGNRNITDTDNLLFKVTIKYRPDNWFFRWRWHVDEILKDGSTYPLSYAYGYCLSKNNAMERAYTFINKLVERREKSTVYTYRVPKNVRLKKATNG